MKNYDDIKSEINGIKNEVDPGANTAERVGTSLSDILDFANEKSMKISGTVNLAKAEGKTTLQNAYNGLGVGEMAFYLVTDSNGLLPSPNQAYVTVEDSVRSLFTTDSALGASVGDIVVVAKMKVLLMTVPVYKILPLNDAKAASGSFPGAMGLESPWDKNQVNKIPTALQFPTRGGDNMNNCLEPGIYPWCTLGRPAGATGAFTLSVAKSTTADNAGYYTIEQTCYGRQGEAGRIFRRILFQNASETQYNDWVEVTGAGSEFDKKIYYCPGSFKNLTASSTTTQIEAVIGSIYTVIAQEQNGRCTFIDVDGVIATLAYTSGGSYAISYFDGSYIYLININTNNNSATVKSYLYAPVNNLTSTSTDSALSANQGKVLNDKIREKRDTYYVYSLSITDLTADSSQEDIIAACGGSFGGVQNAIKASKDIVFF